MTASFTKRFQYALRDEIERLLRNWPHRGTIIQQVRVGVEGVPFDTWSGRPDIWIGKWDDRRGVLCRTKLGVIEIEQWSGAGQARKNLDQAIQWKKGGSHRRIAFLHLLHTTANLSFPAWCRLIDDGCAERGTRFWYDYRAYETDDQRMHKRKARQLAQSPDFQVLLWRMLRFLGFVGE